MSGIDSTTEKPGQETSDKRNHENLFPQFVLFGDSQIQFSMIPRDGWSFDATLQNALAFGMYRTVDKYCFSDFMRRLDVVNRGFSGYNSTQALETLPRVLDGLSPGPIRFFLLFFGTNDAALPGTTGQHVNLQTYRSNLKSIITYPRLVAQHPKIILVTPPPIDEIKSEETEARKNGTSEPVRSARITAEYAAALRELAREVDADLVLVDLWSKIIDDAIKETGDYVPGKQLPGSKELGSNNILNHLLLHGLHLSTKGYKILYEEVFSALKKRWPEEGPETHPFVFPYWRDLVAKS